MQKSTKCSNRNAASTTREQMHADARDSVVHANEQLRKLALLATPHVDDDALGAPFFELLQALDNIGRSVDDLATIASGKAVE
jgi:hypothetical protein